MQPSDSQKKQRNLLSLFANRNTEGRAQDIPARLKKCAGSDGIEILRALFDRLEDAEQGVDAERFRIEFKDRRDEIDRLRPRFITDEDITKRAYRPGLIALPLIENERARKLLTLIDDVLRYLSRAYEEQPGRKITLGELSKHFKTTHDEVGEALLYVNESPASSSRTSGYPSGPDWYVLPGEQSLDYPDLDSVLNQLTVWTERDAAAPRYSYAAALNMNDRDPAPSWLSKHKGLAFVIATGVTAVIGFLANTATVIDFLTKLFGAR